ncbi:hypothetical protein J2R96_002159 [Bradyrhizobium elkanii]|nr:hypothetical protein [Bradyrhizobium elkanii]
MAVTSFGVVLAVAIGWKFRGARFLQISLSSFVTVFVAIGPTETAVIYRSPPLETNFGDLLARIKSGRYIAPPVRRHYIPKADGTERPLGIPTLEDKVAQRAAAGADL